MKPLELLFALLRQFINFPPNRVEDLQLQSKQWEAEQRALGDDSKVKKALLFCDRWYIQVLLACLSLPIIKGIGNWLMSKNEPELIDDDEDEEEMLPATGVKKFNLYG